MQEESGRDCRALVKHERDVWRTVTHERNIWHCNTWDLWHTVTQERSVTMHEIYDTVTHDRSMTLTHESWHCDALERFVTWRMRSDIWRMRETYGTLTHERDLWHTVTHERDLWHCDAWERSMTHWLQVLCRDVARLEEGGEISSESCRASRLPCSYYYYYCCCWIVQSLCGWAMSSTIGVQFQAGEHVFFLCHRVRMGSGSYPPS